MPCTQVATLWRCKVEHRKGPELQVSETTLESQMGPAIAYTVLILVMRYTPVHGPLKRGADLESLSWP